MTDVKAEKVVQDDLGNWFRRIGTQLSGVDYEEGVHLLLAVDHLRQQLEYANGCLKASSHNELAFADELREFALTIADLRQQLADVLELATEANSDCRRWSRMVIERDAAIERAPHDEDCSLNTWRDWWRDDPAPAPKCNCWKSAAPSTTLDGVKAEVWYEGYAARVQQVESEQRYDTPNPYRKEV